ncbi:MAG: T9SS type A sorting domain-containing protein [Flavobacteriaceae bacterium]|nr:T9SS type A sorting domain-containing protein [Flavobacteriaceae bacterium]
MKKITLLFVCAIFTISGTFAQRTDSTLTNREKAENYLASRGEVHFIFQAESKEQLQEISRFLSLGHMQIDGNLLEVDAYANQDTFQQFLEYGLPYKVRKDDNELPFDAHLAGTSPEAIARGMSSRAAWDTTWDAYPKYSEYVAKMQYYATTYPSICSLESIGTTQSGRELLVLKITDNVSVNEGEPEFFYTSSMHGDEIAGFPLMIRLIDYLLTNYGTDTEVTDLVNSTEIYINPSANPDGTYRLGDTDAVDNPRRANDSGQDLNRNYPDNLAGLHDSSIGGVYEDETIAFMNYADTKNFVLSANHHGGISLFNYPIDNTLASNYTHPDGAWFERLGVNYAIQVRADNAAHATPEAGYFTVDYDSNVYPSQGVTHGAEWYLVYGGRQDYMGYYKCDREVTIELSDQKWLAPSKLPAYWDYNKQALLDFMKEANYGLHGVITDESGNPVKAEIRIASHDARNSFRSSESELGEYHRLIEGGTYNVTYSAPGYVSQTISVTITNGAKTVQDVTLVATTANPVAADAQLCDSGTTALSATGSGTLNWYDSIDATSPVFTGANFTTPTLTSTTSYFVEDVISKGNVGNTANNSNGGNFTSTDRYLVFDCTESVVLEQVTINALNAGEVEVELQDASGNIINSAVKFVNAGIQVIDLNFIVPVGTDLRLIGDDFSTGGLYRNNSGVSYPYTNGSITIKDSNAGPNFYYFFYDWKIESLKSAREEVVVTVDPSPTADFSSVVNPIDNGEVTFTNASSDATSYTWDFGDGSALSTDSNPVYTYGASGTYDVTLTSTNAECGDDVVVKQVTVTTNTLGIDDESINIIGAYPNPFSNDLTIELSSSFNGSNVSLILYDISGRIIRNYNVTNREGVIILGNMNDLANGSYFLKITDLTTNYSAIKQLLKE